MVFTAFQPRKLSPEEVNPFAGAVAKAMEGFNKGIESAYLPKRRELEMKYLPQQMEADLFAKRFGPLATLATTPMFLNNPQFQQALGRMLSEHMPGFGGGNPQGQYGGGNAPTYAGQAAKDIAKAKEAAEKLTRAGKAQTGVSSIAGGAHNYFGDIGKHIIDFFSGGKVNSDLAQNENNLETYLSNLKNNAIQTQRLTSQQAEEVFRARKDETPDSRLARIQETVPNLFKQEGQVDESNNMQPMDQEDQNNNDNQDLAFAADLSRQIKEKYNLDVPETLIFNYMQQVPGDIDINKLIKAAGVKR